MAGNTRGKLKEHFQGIHKDFVWITNHCNDIFMLVENSLKYTEDYIAAGDDEQERLKVLMKNPIYQAASALADSVKTLDSIVGDIYQYI